MSTLIRNDAAVFLVRVYREQIPLEQSKKMRKKVRQLSDEHGRYIRVRESAIDSCDVALDRHVGYLLGESIANHFPSKKNFIYAEFFPEKKQVLLVVIRSGRVQLDVLVSPDEVWSELLPLLAEKIEYEFYHSGFSAQSTLVLPESLLGCAPAVALMASAQELGAPLLDLLPLDPELQLMPCERAIQKSSFSQVRASLWGAAISICVLAISAYFFIGTDLSSRMQHGRQPRDPFIGLYQAISLRSASESIRVSADYIREVSSLSGDSLERVTYDRGYLSFRLNLHTQYLHALSAWAKKNDFALTLLPTSIELKKHLKVSVKSAKRNLYPSNQVYLYLLKNLTAINPDSTFYLDSKKHNEFWNVLSSHWSVKQMTAVDLEWLVKLTEDAPVSCNHFVIDYRDGVMNGNIALKIWGN